MKICCIDVGTNSVLFLLAKIDSLGRLTPVSFRSETTRLGKSLRKTGYINKKSQNRTISAIKKYMDNISADEYIIAGTSALREAKNTNRFKRELYKTTGHNIKILSEKQEAQLAFNSVNYFFKHIPSNTVIFDIGGGSTEIISCKNGKIINKTSIPAGAVNLTEKFGSNLMGMGDFVKENMRKLKISGNYMICAGGTVTTLGAVLKKLRHYDPKKVHKMKISYNHVSAVLKKLSSLPLSGKKEIICFAPERADIIVAGLALLKTIMEVFNIKEFRICERGLVYGLAVEYIQSRESS